MNRADILIAGAGPSGLVLALWLARRGISFRLIDKANGPGEGSRALAVHARTLEFYRQLGLSDRVVEEGIKVTRLGLRANGKQISDAVLSNFGKGQSPFPFVFAYPQDEHERLLIEELSKLGQEVEWETELTGFTQTEERVYATLSSPQGTEKTEALYLCGCDGAHSAVRHAIKADFPGGTYEQIFFVADTQLRGPAPEHKLQIGVTAQDFCIILPVRQTGSVRLIGIVPSSHEEDEEISFEDVAPSVERNTGFDVETVNWFSTYKVHHRVAETFRQGRAFLLGDAAHIHSPAGGQGMNTGIGDAANLAWKLADVLQGRAGAQVLDTYESERIGFARSLVKSTDRVFTFMASRSSFGAVWRAGLLPRALPLLVRISFMQGFLFRLVSQIGIEYRQSALSEGKAGGVTAGDRLPWLGTEDNFAPLSSLGWQVHVYGTSDKAFEDACKKLKLPLHVFGPPKGTGLRQDAAYLLRPDGHVALALPDQAAGRLSDYVSRWRIEGAS